MHAAYLSTLFGVLELSGTVKRAYEEALLAFIAEEAGR